MKDGEGARTAGERLVKLILSMVPWLIIGGLLWAGLFIKPASTGSAVQPPVLEKRDYYYGITSPAAGQVWVTGSGGKIIRLDSSGQAERMRTPTGKTLQGIASWDGQHAVAVGNDGVIIVSADAGASWSLVDNVPRSEVANKLLRVRVAEDGVAVAVGEMGMALLSRDYGKTWKNMRAEEDAAWNDVAILPEGRLVLAGEFGRLAASQDWGATWSDLASPVESSLMAVSFRDAALGVAVGLEGVVLVTRDGGQQWQKVELDAHDHLLDIAWDAAGGRWIGCGNLGRWVRADADANLWQAGRLDARDMSWHTRVLPGEQGIWFAGGNLGLWDGESRWQPLGDAYQVSALFSPPGSLNTQRKGSL